MSIYNFDILELPDEFFDFNDLYHFEANIHHKPLRLVFSVLGLRSMNELFKYSFIDLISNLCHEENKNTYSYGNLIFSLVFRRISSVDFHPNRLRDFAYIVPLDKSNRKNINYSTIVYELESLKNSILDFYSDSFLYYQNLLSKDINFYETIENNKYKLIKVDGPKLNFVNSCPSVLNIQQLPCKKPLFDHRIERFKIRFMGTEEKKPEKKPEEEKNNQNISLHFRGSNTSDVSVKYIAETTY